MRALPLLTLLVGCWSSSSPSPPPPKPEKTEIEPKKVVVKDIVQPVYIEKESPPDDPNALPPPPPPPPPPPAPVQTVPPTILENNRTAGDKLILPDDATKEAIQRSGKTKVIASFKLCVDVAGTVTTVSLLKSSGFPDYDKKIDSAMRTWAYRPYNVNGQAVPVCTAVTFIYAQN